MNVLSALLFTIFLVFLPFQVLAETHNINETIHVEGNFSRKVTAIEKQKRQRKVLEKRTEALVQKQIEVLRLRQEMELAKKLKAMEKILEKKLDNLENI